MPYIGNTPADKFLTLAKQNFSTSATTSYTLDSAVSSTQDIALFINSVRQSPVDAYSVSGTALTLTSATAGTDEMYCVYLGKTVGTVSPASDSVTTAMIQSNAVNNAKMADDAIGLAELSATGTASSSTFLRGDNSWASAGGENAPYFRAYNNGGQTVANNTSVIFAGDTEIVDDGGCYNNTSSNATLNGLTVPAYAFFPNVEGYYFVYGAGRTNSSSTWNYHSVRIWVGSGNTQYGSGVNNNVGYSTAASSAIIYLDGTDDYVRMGYYQSSGGSIDYYGGASETNFGAFKLIT